jgi:hypothetical protein
MKPRALVGILLVKCLLSFFPWPWLRCCLEREPGTGLGVYIRSQLGNVGYICNLGESTDPDIIGVISVVIIEG